VPHPSQSHCDGWECNPLPSQLLLLLLLVLLFVIRKDLALPLPFLLVISEGISFCRCLFALAIVLAAAVVLAVASEVERGFSPASKRPPQSGHRSAEGRSEGEAETTDLLPLLLPLPSHLRYPKAGSPGL